jgi:hypothetical protein
MKGADLERLLFHMPACAQHATTAWAKTFAADMAKRAHWPRWKPSRKQIEIMQGMVNDLFGTSRNEVIER